MVTRISDYGNYLTYKKLRNSSCLILKNQEVAQSQTINDETNNFFNASETIYTTIYPKLNAVSLNCAVSFINTHDNYQDDIICNTIYLLPVSPGTRNGMIKYIINNSKITKINSVTLHSKNNSQNGGFYNLGSYYNTYVFVCEGDNLELLWSREKNAWVVLKYGGIFKNINIGDYRLI